MSDPIRLPKQARSHETLNRIRTATDALLVERAGASLTVEDIVLRAQSSVGAFYTRFGGKDAAVADAHERYWDSWRGNWETHLDPERWQGLGAIEIVAGLVRHLARNQFRDARRLRGFWMNALADSSGQLVARTVKLDGYVAGAVGRLLAQSMSAPGQRSARRLARDGFLIIINALRDRVISAGMLGVPAEAEQRRMILVLTRMYAALLGVRPSVGSYSDVLRLARRAPRFPLG